MKKTVLALILAFVMLAGVLSLTSCGSPLDSDDAIAAMKFVDEQMAGVKGFVGTMTMTSEGVEMEADIKIDISGDTPKMYMNTEIMGMSIEATLVDGTMYMLIGMGDMTVKQKTTDKDQIDDMMGDLNSVGEDYEYASAEFVSRENGVYVMKATLSELDAKDMIGDLGDLEASDISATVTYYCNAEGKVSKTVAEYSYTVEGETIDGVIEMAFTSLEVPTITAPADADQYQEAETE